VADSADSLREKLAGLATEETYLNAYARRRTGDRYDRELITFTVAGETYGIDIARMQEIIKLRPITEVPRVPAFVKGVVAVRGQVIPAIDLRMRLGLAPAELAPATRILVCVVDDEPHGLIVDRVASVVRLRNEQVEAAPALGAGGEVTLLSGIGRTDDKLIILLDVPAVVTFSLEETK
jgi:purine-binding chemotaxis protein CheW